MSFLSAMQRILAKTQPLHDKLEAYSIPCVLPADVLPAPRLHPTPQIDIIKDVLQKGCTPDVAEKLSEAFQAAVLALAQSAQDQLARTYAELVNIGMSSAALHQYRNALSVSFSRQVHEDCEAFKARCLREVDEDQAAHGQDELEVHDAIGLRTHTESQVAILNAFRDNRLAAGKPVSFNKVERQLIAAQSGLSDAQILNYYSNYRNRGSKVEKRLATAKFNNRHTPYPSPAARRPSTHSHIPLRPTRNFSSSSSSSLDSTISYESTSSFNSLNDVFASASVSPLSVSHDTFIAPLQSRGAYSDWDSCSSSGSSATGEDAFPLEEQEALLRLLESQDHQNRTPTANSFPIHSSYPSPAFSYATSSSSEQQNYDSYQSPSPWYPPIASPPSAHAQLNPNTYRFMAFDPSDFDVAKILGVDDGRGALTLPIEAAQSDAGASEYGETEMSSEEDFGMEMESDGESEQRY
ncbi:hypothetical protein P7C70_g6584, partial [Phenoliferia sp. Uapishka_3]